MSHKRKLDELQDQVESKRCGPDVGKEAIAAVVASSEPTASILQDSNHVTASIPHKQQSDEAVESIWEVVESKPSKKQKKKEKPAEGREDHDSLPALRFSTPISAPLRLKDLQSLVLYVLSDGIAPQWVAVNKAKHIGKVVVLMVPGISKDVLEDFVSSTDQQRKLSDAKDRRNDNDVQSNASDVKDQDLVDTARPYHHVTRSLCIVPFEAPGDKRTGRFHSPLQTMLISPKPKAQADERKARQGAFKPERTPIQQYVHSPEELMAAEHSIHPALFTNTGDAELESQRRELSGQTTANGWVDTNVVSATPEAGSSQQDRNSLTQGLAVYSLDCEMVLTTDDKYSLARISVLNWLGKTVLDRFVQPSLPIKDYFTQFSGVTPAKLQGVTTQLADIQTELLKILTPSAVLVGHSLDSDLKALKMTHPFVVDTSILYPHPRGLPLRSSLKYLANKYLRREIQTGTQGHDSVEDSRAALDLVRLKCERGPRFGVPDADGESIFSRLTRSGRRSAIVDHGNQDRGFGQHATIKVACENDSDVVRGVVSIMDESRLEAKDTAFVFARLCNMERLNGSKNESTGEASRDDLPETSLPNGNTRDTSDAILSDLLSIHNCLPPSTMLIIYPGPGDMTEVLRLQKMYKTYQHEFKVKKWDELSVQWTDNEVQALTKAFKQASKGWALLGITLGA